MRRHHRQIADMLPAATRAAELPRDRADRVLAEIEATAIAKQLAATVPEPNPLIAARASLERLAGDLERARQERDRCRAIDTQERQNKPSWRDRVTGTGASRAAEAELACAAAERAFDGVDQHHRRQTEWLRLLVAAHEHQVKARAEPARLGGEQIKVVQEARRILSRTPRMVRWGPVVLMAMAMQRAGYEAHAVGARGEGPGPDFRNIVDIWGVPLGPR